MNGWANAMLLWSWQALLVVGAVFFIVQAGRLGTAAQRHRWWLGCCLLIAALPVANSLVRLLPVTPTMVSPIVYVQQWTKGSGQLPPDEQRMPGFRDNASIAALGFSRGDLARRALFILWLAGMVVTLARSLTEYRRVRRLRSAAVPADSQGLALPVGYSRDVSSPVLVGILHPAILLPDRIREWTSDEERRAIVLHEFAHFERRDHFVVLLQTLLGAVFFYHPAVRFALRRLGLERELACDEHVLKSGASPSVYVEALLKVAERAVAVKEHPTLAFNTSAKILARRVHMILNHAPSTSKRSLVLPVLRTAVLAGMIIVVLPQRAVTFAEPGAPVAEAPQTSTAVEMAQPQNLSAVIPSEPAAQVSTFSGPVATAAAVVSSPAMAQSPTLSGTIFDQTGAVIPGVMVSLTSVENAIVQLTAVTDARGAYSFPPVNPGGYALEAALPGFTTFRRRMTLWPGPAIQDVILQLGKVAVQIDVTAPRPTTAPALPVTPNGPTRVGGDVSAPSLIYAPKPVYPPTARARQIQDVVVLQAVISSSGSVASLQVDPEQSIGSVPLVQAAMDAVRQWRYEPATLNGVPIEFPITVTVNFTLSD